MTIDKTPKTDAPTKAAAPLAAQAHSNRTDATQGEPLAVRARTRQAQLQALLVKTPSYDAATRGDIELALSAVTQLLTGDTEHLSDATAAELSRWLEGAKQLGETVTPGPAAKA